MSCNSLETISQNVMDFIYHTFPRASKKHAGIHDRLLEERIIDSLGLLEIITFIEETYGITVNDDDISLDKFASISTISEYVINKKNHN